MAKIEKREAEHAVCKLILYIRQFDFLDDKLIRGHYGNLIELENWLLNDEDVKKEQE